MKILDGFLVVIWRALLPCTEAKSNTPLIKSRTMSAVNPLRYRIIASFCRSPCPPWSSSRWRRMSCTFPSTRPESPPAALAAAACAASAPFSALIARPSLPLLIRSRLRQSPLRKILCTPWEVRARRPVARSCSCNSRIGSLAVAEISSLIPASTTTTSTRRIERKSTTCPKITPRTMLMTATLPLRPTLTTSAFLPHFSMNC